MYCNKRLAIRVIWNLLGLYLCVSGLVESISLPLPAHLIKGGVWQFLTNTSLLVSCLCMLCIICTNITRVFKNTAELIRKSVTNLENLCCNLEFVVTVTYWTIILFCPEMLNGKSFDVSWVLDLKIHLLPYMFLLIDLLLFRNNQKMNSSSFASSFGLSVVFLGLYWSLVEISTSVLNDDGITKFPYPFLNDSNFIRRTGWFLVFLGLAFVNHNILYYTIKLASQNKIHAE